jgi:hypothetical protein
MEERENGNGGGSKNEKQWLVRDLLEGKPDLASLPGNFFCLWVIC